MRVYIIIFSLFLIPLNINRTLIASSLPIVQTKENKSRNDSRNEIKKLLIEVEVAEEAEDYEKALESYKEAMRIYPSMNSPKIMIKQIKELIQRQSI